MKPDDVKKYFCTYENFRKKTGMSPTNLSNWFKWGFVPERSQYKIEMLTNGALKAEWSRSENVRKWCD